MIIINEKERQTERVGSNPTRLSRIARALSTSGSFFSTVASAIRIGSPTKKVIKHGCNYLYVHISCTANVVSLFGKEKR